MLLNFVINKHEQCYGKKVLSLGLTGFAREMCRETMNELDLKKTEVILQAKSSKSLTKILDTNIKTKMVVLTGTHGGTDHLKISKSLIMIMTPLKMLGILSLFLTLVKHAESSMMTGN